MSEDPFRVIDEEYERDLHRRHAIGAYLAQLMGQENAVLAHLGYMAGSVSFTFVRSLRWVGSDVKLAIDLPFMDALKNEEGEIEIEADNLHLVRQRPVNWERQKELARYLVAEPLHQFPPLLLVITSTWAEDPNDEVWVDGRATKSTFSYKRLGELDSLVELSLDRSEFMIYALDGQHRVVGIRGALEIIDTGLLQPKDRRGKPKGQPIQRDEWLNDERGLAEVNRVPSETIGIHLVPGVIQGETMEDARRRISSVFVHVNQSANPLTEGQVIVIDQNDPFALVAQRLSTNHALLKNRTDFEKAQLAKKSEMVTTLSSIHKSARAYLKEFPGYESWKPAKKGKSVAQKRPESEVSAATNRLGAIWSKVAGLPCFLRLSDVIPPSVSEMRNCGEGNQAHLLYRPVGQNALFGAVADLERAGVALDAIFAALARCDLAGGFRIDDFAWPWCGVIYDPAGDRVKSSGEDLTRRLIVHLVLPSPNSLEELRLAFAEGRKSKEGFARDFNGEEVPIDAIRLPHPV
jgi:hypothetical protein